MKKTYAPSLESISAKYGERYFTVTTRERGHKSTSALQYGDLKTIIYMMEATIYGIDPRADLGRWSARISYEGRALVIMPDCAGPDSAQVVPQPLGDRYEIYQIDAVMYDDNWTYNSTYRLGSFTTTSADVSRAFRRTLKSLGVSFTPGATRTVYDEDVYEITGRKTGEPLFIVIPEEA